MSCETYCGTYAPITSGRRASVPVCAGFVQYFLGGVRDQRTLEHTRQLHIHMYHCVLGEGKHG